MLSPSVRKREDKDKISPIDVRSSMILILPVLCLEIRGDVTVKEQLDRNEKGVVGNVNTSTERAFHCHRDAILSNE
jgi:hypothetical protein